MKTRWGIVILAIGAGIVAGVQVGKVPPLINLLRAEMALSLVGAGWLASLFNLTGAIFGIAGGALTDRLGARRVLLAGLAGLAVTGVVGALATSAGWLLGARILESVAFLACVVSAPRLIAAATAPRHRDFALGAWGTYMPAGIALAMLTAPWIADGAGWRGVWLAAAALAAVCLLPAGYLTAPRRWPAVPMAGTGLRLRDLLTALTRPAPLLLGGCFTLYAIQFFAVTAWLPSYLVEVLGLSPGQAGPATALVVAGNAVGGLLTALLLHRGARRWLLIGSAFVLMMACATGIFAEAVAVEWKLPLAFLFNFCGGLLPGSVLAAAAAHAPSPGMLGSFNGVVVQSANIGSLIGPPAMALAIGPAGAWSDSHGLILACGGLGLCLALLLGLVERKPPAPS